MKQYIGFKSRFFHFWMAIWALGVLLIGGYGSDNATAADEKAIKVNVNPDRKEALYKPGEPAVFSISVFSPSGAPISTGKIDVALTLDSGKLINRKTLELNKQPVTISGTLDTPGFLSCTATYAPDGKPCFGMAAAGFDPQQISPAAEMPADFDAFWAQGRKACAAVPLDLQLTPLPKFSTPQVDSFSLSFANINNTRMYGYLSVPKNKPGPFPAIVIVPSAGIGKPREANIHWAGLGALTLYIGVHAVELGQDKEKYAEYAKQFEPAYTAYGIPDKKNYYYYRAILGVDRAINWLAARPDFDKKHLVVNGSSQGGGFSIIMAGLNSQVTAIAASVPALCDHNGVTVGRASGWPGLPYLKDEGERQKALEMFRYYDAVNFARKIPATVPAIVAVGFIDTTCCPSSVYAAYNTLKGPKRIFNAPNVGHSAGPEYSVNEAPWIQQQLGL